MCSIVGAAGPFHQLSSKLKQELHDFLSCLFAMAERRGRDASGFWVWRKNYYLMQKRAIPAEDLVQRSPVWKGLRFNPGTLYLMHTRAATDGDPNLMINNHPHVGEHSVMIHNGIIMGHESLAQQNGISLVSDCDSEVILRLAEQRDDMRDGIEHMYKVIGGTSTSDSIACAFVDRRNPDRIWLSRNTSNPCSIYHSTRFNGTFFCSTQDIFERALEHLYNNKSPSIIGAKEDVVTPHHMYELTDDGEFKYSHLVTVKPYNTVQYLSDDDTDGIEYIKTYFGSTPKTINILGYVDEIETSFEEEQSSNYENYWEDDSSEHTEFTEASRMPVNVEKALRNYLEFKLGLKE